MGRLDHHIKFLSPYLVKLKSTEEISKFFGVRLLKKDNREWQLVHSLSIIGQSERSEFFVLKAQTTLIQGPCFQTELIFENEWSFSKWTLYRIFDSFKIYGLWNVTEIFSVYYFDCYVRCERWFPEVKLKTGLARSDKGQNQIG